MALTSGSKILVSDVKGAVKGFSVSGKTVTFTKLDGTTGTFTTQDTNTTYSAGTRNKHFLKQDNKHRCHLC